MATVSKHPASRRRRCQDTVKALEEINEGREPFDSVLHNDRIFSEHAWGWYGHLLVILDDVVQRPTDCASGHRARLPPRQTVCRLLILETTLRQYKLETGKLPNRLSELVPKYISKSLSNPFDANQGPIRYSRTADGSLVYSVGYDGDDDHGRPSSRKRLARRRRHASRRDDERR